MRTFGASTASGAADEWGDTFLTGTCQGSRGSKFQLENYKNFPPPEPLNCRKYRTDRAFVGRSLEVDVHQPPLADCLTADGGRRRLLAVRRRGSGGRCPAKLIGVRGGGGGGGSGWRRRRRRLAAAPRENFEGNPLNSGETDVFEQNSGGDQGCQVTREDGGGTRKLQLMTFNFTLFSRTSPSRPPLLASDVWMPRPLALCVWMPRVARRGRDISFLTPQFKMPAGVRASRPRASAPTAVRRNVEARLARA